MMRSSEGAPLLSGPVMSLGSSIVSREWPSEAGADARPENALCFVDGMQSVSRESERIRISQ